MKMIFKSLVAFFMFSILTMEAEAGLLLAPSVSWDSYAFRPVLEEETPNYYGYGLGMQLGYSAVQTFDLAGYFNYTPGNLDAADPFDSNSELYQYGGVLGFRIYNAIYLAFHGGVVNYALPVRAKVEEVGGEWSGSGYGFKLGGIIPLSRTFAWQIALGVTTATVTDNSGDYSGSRKIDNFSLSLSLVYNSEDTLGFVDAIFTNSIQSLFR